MLQKIGIWSVGTIPSNRLRGCDLQSEKYMKKQGRGSCESMRPLSRQKDWCSIGSLDRPVARISTMGAQTVTGGASCSYERRRRSLGRSPSRQRIFEHLRNFGLFRQHI